jgi:thiosulfate dehydrogenase (quinone) large subunit
MRAAAVQYIKEPRVARWLFGKPSASYIWLVARLWLGYEWTKAGASKIWGAESAGFWRGGAGLKGFAEGAIAAHKGAFAQVSYGWWVEFLRDVVVPGHVWMAKLVSLGEFMVGIALILGLFTGIAAFTGLLLNFTYVLSGAVSVNPIYMLIGVGLILAWRNAGLIGADGLLLPKLGTPWQPAGPLFKFMRHLPGTKQAPQGA